MVKIHIGVSGMMCSKCEARLDDAIRSRFKVTKVSTSHTSGSAEIIAENDIPQDQLRSVIEQTGYQLISYDSEPYEKKNRLFFKT